MLKVLLFGKVLNNMGIYEDYQEYSTNQEYRETMEFFNEHFIFLNDKPILVCGNPKEINFEDKDIHYENDCMICGAGNNRKWREFRDEYKDGTFGEPYIMTYAELLYTFGEAMANSVFDTGEVCYE